ncbi:Gas vesicle protein [Anoxybacillus thermarum]|uniref:Gas vesicle protein n=1 Tax=Anoxybacillus thermarum TaxID=404937 RepID=A0A0D0RPP9_9BACL|nr:hypothetical protein [Anoxybacillus thermarum]KIQ93712.1 Gas vesicle protein [Anoxybacillus thermarum]
MAKNGSFLLGAIVGGIAGAAAALFLSSERGKQLLTESTEQGKQLLNELKESNINKWGKSEEKEEPTKSEQEKPQAVSSIPIPLPSSDVEQLLKETEQAVHDAEKRLNKGTDAHGES